MASETRCDERRTPHVCNEDSGHTGPHFCSCGFGWDRSPVAPVPAAPAPEATGKAHALPYPPDVGGTHNEGCYRERGHHNCAVAYADALLSERAAQAREIETLRAALEGLMPHMDDAAADGETEFERAVLKARAALAARAPEPAP